MGAPVVGSGRMLLHMLRHMQANNQSGYWDEPQKDGTSVRFWGKVTNIQETYNQGGPNQVLDFTFEFEIEGVAIYSRPKDTTGVNAPGGFLMTDIIPYGTISSNIEDYTNQSQQRDIYGGDY
jgi:hypothetical protein